MRKLIYAINLSLDGTCDHTKMDADEEMHEYHRQLVLSADTFVYGRVTYQLMVPFWPDVAKSQSADTKDIKDFADAFAAVKNIVVFSKSLTKPLDEKTTIVRSNLKEEILKLKQQDGKSILTGGVNIPSQLIELGLVDEFHFVVQPVIAGDGVRLLKGVSLPETMKLNLIGSKVLSSGCVALRFAKK